MEKFSPPAGLPPRCLRREAPRKGGEGDAAGQAALPAGRGRPAR